MSTDIGSDERTEFDGLTGSLSDDPGTPEEQPTEPAAVDELREYLTAVLDHRYSFWQEDTGHTHDDDSEIPEALQEAIQEQFGARVIVGIATVCNSGGIGVAWATKTGMWGVSWAPLDRSNGKGERLYRVAIRGTGGLKFGPMESTAHQAMGLLQLWEAFPVTS